MLIQLIDHLHYAIHSPSGALMRSAVFHLWAEAGVEDSPEAFQAAVELFAGRAGAPWRKPDAAGTGYVLDDSICIVDVKVTPLDSMSMEVRCSGVAAVFYLEPDALPGTPAAAEAERALTLTSVKRERGEDGTELAIFEWVVGAEHLAALVLPEVGEAVTDAGEAFICMSCQQTCIASLKYQVKLVARKVVERQVGALNRTENADGSVNAEVVFEVPNGAVTDFLARYPVGGSAAAWTEEGFQIAKSAVTSQNKLFSTVRLTARNMACRCLEKFRTERFVGYSAPGVPEYEVVWNARFRVDAEHVAAFSNLAGCSAESWAESGFVVTAVTPKPVSDADFEYVLEAQSLDSIDFIGNRRKARANYRKLSSRKEYRAQLADFKLSAQQCGYRSNGAGSYVLLENWAWGRDCPLESNGVLPFNWIGQNRKVVEVAIVSYLSGDSLSHVADLIAWNNSSRLEELTLGTLSAIWLKQSLDTEDLTDNKGNAWTRIQKRYRMPPDGYTWNADYWNREILG